MCRNVKIASRKSVAVSYFMGKQPDMHVHVRAHDIWIYLDYTGRRYTQVDGTLSIHCLLLFAVKVA